MCSCLLICPSTFTTARFLITWLWTRNMLFAFLPMPDHFSHITTRYALRNFIFSKSGWQWTLNSARFISLCGRTFTVFAPWTEYGTCFGAGAQEHNDHVSFTLLGKPQDIYEYLCYFIIPPPKLTPVNSHHIRCKLTGNLKNDFLMCTICGGIPNAIAISVLMKCIRYCARKWGTQLSLSTYFLEVINFTPRLQDLLQFALLKDSKPFSDSGEPTDRTKIPCEVIKWAHKSAIATDLWQPWPPSSLPTRLPAIQFLHHQRWR